MEILRRGTPPDEILITCRCDKCLSELRFAQSEAKLKNDTTGYSNIPYTEIACPVCGYTLINNYVTRIS